MRRRPRERQNQQRQYAPTRHGAAHTACSVRTLLAHCHLLGVGLAPRSSRFLARQDRERLTRLGMEDAFQSSPVLHGVRVRVREYERASIPRGNPLSCITSSLNSFTTSNDSFHSAQSSAPLRLSLPFSKDQLVAMTPARHARPRGSVTFSDEVEVLVRTPTSPPGLAWREKASGQHLVRLVSACSNTRCAVLAGDL